MRLAPAKPEEWTGTVDVAWLEGIAVDKAPPCECKYVNKTTGHEFFCRKPSVVRLRINCPCGKSGIRFCCKICYEDIKSGGAFCYACGRTDFHWNVML